MVDPCIPIECGDVLVVVLVVDTTDEVEAVVRTLDLVLVLIILSVDVSLFTSDMSSIFLVSNSLWQTSSSCLAL